MQNANWKMKDANRIEAGTRQPACLRKENKGSVAL